MKLNRIGSRLEFIQLNDHTYIYIHTQTQTHSNRFFDIIYCHRLQNFKMQITSTFQNIKNLLPFICDQKTKKLILGKLNCILLRPRQTSSAFHYGVGILKLLNYHNICFEWILLLCYITKIGGICFFSIVIFVLFRSIVIKRH